jgi:uncharacterized membrane protein YfcA
VDPQDAVAVFFLTAFASTAQSVTGFGFGLIIIPPLVLILGPKDAVALSTVLGTALALLMLARLHAGVPWRPVGVALVGTALGAPVGLLVLVTLDKDILQITIAVAVLVATAVLARGFRVPTASDVGPAIAGFVAGITRMTAGLPGPPVVLYFQAMRLAAGTQRAAITAFFATSGFIGVALFAGEGSLDREIAGLTLGGMPGIGLGWLAGGHLFSRMSQRVFTAIVYIMLVGSALLAIAAALT